MEVALSFPFLLLMAALIFGVAIASIRKSEVAAAARHDAWRKRPNAHAQDALSLSALTSGEISDSASRTVSLPSSVYGQGSLTAKSRNLLLAASWSHPDIEFDSSTPDFVPHSKPLGGILNNALPGVSPGLVSALDAIGQAFSRLESLLSAGELLATAANGLVKAAGILVAPFNESLYEATLD
jgi:hypothetical protein